jgi:ribosomal protein S18 acetylase RimI-like enzyme
MKYCLRNITEHDKDFIYNLKKSSIYEFVQRIWGWDEEYQIKDFEADFNLEDFKIIVIEDKYVGFVQTNENQSNINIAEIHIVPLYQSNGIGSSIIKNIISQADNEDKTVTLGCFIENTGAKHLYEKLGFRVIKTTDTHYIMQLQ